MAGGRLSAIGLPSEREGGRAELFHIINTIAPNDTSRADSFHLGHPAHLVLLLFTSHWYTVKVDAALRCATCPYRHCALSTHPNKYREQHSLESATCEQHEQREGYTSIPSQTFQGDKWKLRQHAAITIGIGHKYSSLQRIANDLRKEINSQVTKGISWANTAQGYMSILPARKLPLGLFIQGRSCSRKYNAIQAVLSFSQEKDHCRLTKKFSSKQIINQQRDLEPWSIPG